MLWAFVQWVEFVGHVSEYHLLGRWSQGGMGNGVSIPYFMSRSFRVFGLLFSLFSCLLLLVGYFIIER